MTEIEKYQHISSQLSGEAHSLPFSVYTDKEIYVLERAKIFHHDWVFVCAEKELPNSGDYFAFTLANEPLILIRGEDQSLRILSNVCRHRGTVLNDEGFGHSKRFICPYHAWTYNDQGELIAIPHAGNSEIDKSNHCLPAFAIELWQGLIFVSLNKNIEPLIERYAGLQGYIDAFQAERFTETIESNTETWSANWKLAMENGMESYHLFKVHKDTLETVTPTKQAFYVEGSADWTITAGKIDGVGNKLWEIFQAEKSILYEHYLLISLPPSFVGILDYESFSWISVLPKNETECWIRSGGLSTRKKQNDHEKAFVDAFFAEDKDICERVQRGMQASHTEGGKLVDLERVVVDFHQYLSNRLFDTEKPKSQKTKEANIFLEAD